MYYFAAHALKIILRLFGRLSVYEKQNVPTSGGYVIACTHTGWVDILWLGVSVLPTKIHYMAKKELFQTRFLKWLMEGLHAFPVDRENPGPSTIKIPRRLLSEGKVVGIFPSGTRTSEEVPLKRGAVTIAGHANVPIIPVAYSGPNNFKDLLTRVKPKIIYGKPIYLSTDLTKKEGMEVMLAELNQELRLLQQKLQSK
ncbi:MAG: lysophospholipid acyltransferase family protein [Bacillota bacterium]|uniref:1-acyl-sn-glycerol-3-phosphate acyltransferase n=1 Tax=Virgibacillus salarius TaxID=447199 RepID=A0A941IA55_9BACI|nr:MULTISPECIES: lysophospholipid acyltransferase family protein [Bacillaceae]NAZ09001.1 1-acylglycerol-3-phosphate O-acyltransferase [Agaribacter marinus]MBR7796293.1 1-acyl-sn-glycerol-3-phosphate acyltransferase [Virgibacillus salarius]MCC2248525.1 1-acyl-sn-glycerol-3-phosphate acyltransferase [Virgibacillus sp. AGTR]MDY7043040.1 lysophospholipid acyltransferase family protein [Virgibacillus sp. M23]QRZ16614.1 1-acyl-sn-glycerol-3-phosphate acyltransferase [Virgibacillus sp. AGTR]